MNLSNKRRASNDSMAQQEINTWHLKCHLIKQNESPIIWKITMAKLENFYQESISSANYIKAICLLGECYLLSYFVRGAVLGPWDTFMNKTKIPALKDLIFWWRRKTININIINISLIQYNRSQVLFKKEK